MSCASNIGENPLKLIKRAKLIIKDATKIIRDVEKIISDCTDLIDSWTQDVVVDEVDRAAICVDSTDDDDPSDFWRDDVDHQILVYGENRSLKKRKCAFESCPKIVQLEMCREHLDSEMGLAVKVSKIANSGYGLFATKHMKQKHAIGEFIDSNHECKYRHKYLIDMKKGHVIDCAINRCAVACANGSKGSMGINSKLIIKDGARIRTTKVIAVGEEIIYSYGSSYEWGVK